MQVDGVSRHIEESLQVCRSLRNWHVGGAHEENAVEQMAPHTLSNQVAQGIPRNAPSLRNRSEP